MELAPHLRVGWMEHGVLELDNSQVFDWMERRSYGVAGEFPEPESESYREMCRLW